MKIDGSFIKSLTIFSVFACLALQLFSFQPSFVIKSPLTYILLLILVCQFLADHYKQTFIFRLLEKYRTVFICLFSLCIVFTIFGKNIQAQWGPIDDHEIVSYLGTDQRLSVSELPNILANSEATKPGITLRYRPVYQMLRVLEVLLWGNNPTLWYGFRLILLVVSVALVCLVLNRSFGFFLSMLLIIYIFTYQMWADMFARLGPSETYSVLGLALYVFGVDQLIHQMKAKQAVSTSAILTWFIGTFICVGSKENFVLLLIPNLALYAYAFIQKEKSKLFWFASATAMIWILFVASAFSMAAFRSGTDVYGRSVGVSRVSVLNTGIRHNQFKEMVLFSVVLAAYAALLFIYKDKHKNLLTAGVISSGIIAFCAMIFLSQYVFYNGDWPNSSRYDFPGVLVIPVYCIVFLMFWYRVLQTYTMPRVALDGLWYGAWAGLICITIMRGYVATLVKVADNVRVTRAYTKQIQETAKILKEQPTRAVVIESGNPWDYEPIYAVSKFLRAYGAKNTLYLRMHNYSPNNVGQGLEKQLATELLDLQTNGGGEYTSLPTHLNNCFSILLIDTPTECEVIRP